MTAENERERADRDDVYRALLGHPACTRCGDVRRTPIERVVAGYVALACARCFNEWTAHVYEFRADDIEAIEAAAATVRIAEAGTLHVLPWFDAVSWRALFARKARANAAAREFFETPRP